MEVGKRRHIRSLIIVLAVMLLVPCLMPYNGVSVVNLTPDKIAAFTENLGRVMLTLVASLIAAMPAYANRMIAADVKA